MPSEIGRTPEIQPEGLIPASPVIEPLVGLAGSRDSSPAITCLGMPLPSQVHQITGVLRTSRVSRLYRAPHRPAK